MLYRGESPHPAHQGFADAIDADLVGLDRLSFGDHFRHSIPEEIINGLAVPKYDVYIAEGTRALYGALANQVISNSFLIYLAADQSLYGLTNNSYTHEKCLNYMISEFGMGPLIKLFNKYIDGVIAVSDFTIEYISRILIDKPMEVAHPYIQPEIYRRLGDVTPTIDQEVAVTVGTYAQYKGQDILVESWPLVREEFPNAELKLIGAGYPTQLGKIPGVSVLGYVDDLPAALSTASLYVQPSRADAFPVSVLEAMRAGIPPIVTDTTGNKSEVQKIDDQLITGPFSEKISNSITNYFTLQTSDRRGLSRSARKIGSDFDSKSRKKAFQNSFKDLINKLIFN